MPSASSLWPVAKTLFLLGGEEGPAHSENACIFPRPECAGVGTTLAMATTGSIECSKAFLLVFFTGPWRPEGVGGTSTGIWQTIGARDHCLRIHSIPAAKRGTFFVLPCCEDVDVWGTPVGKHSTLVSPTDLHETDFMEGQVASAERIRCCFQFPRQVQCNRIDQVKDAKVPDV